MELIWHGTATVEAICGQGRILFDPFVPLKGSPVPGNIEDYDGCTDIFVTHCHLDHVLDLPEIAKRNPGVVIHCTQAPFDALRKKGVPQGSLDLIRYGDTRTVNGFTVRIYHGKHAVLPKVDAARIRSWVRSPARWNVPRMLQANRDYRESDETVFYLLEADGKTAALMGSMNLRDEVEYPTCADVLVLPYNGWTDNLPPAVRTVERLKPKRILLDHYDNTFPPVSPPVDLSPVLQKYAGLATAMFYGKAERI